MASTKKKYGLILASARRAEELKSATGGGGVRKINVLRTSDDELEEDDPQHEEESQHSKFKKRGEGNSAQQAQQLRLMREALEEDPSIFMYDEHYDEQKAKETAIEVKKQQNNEPKYIGRILQSAQRRQLERERCTVRKLQKERDAEQGLYDDKESFVTPAYVKKLEEIRQAEAREKMMEVIEEKNDAMREKATGLFYKEIFNQRFGGDSVAEGSGHDDGTVRGKSPGDARQNSDSGRGSEAESSHRKRSRSPLSGDKRIKRKPTDRQSNPGDHEKMSSYGANSGRDGRREDSDSKRSSDDSHTSNRKSGISSREYRNSEKSKHSKDDQNTTDDDDDDDDSRPPTSELNDSKRVKDRHKEKSSNQREKNTPSKCKDSHKRGSNSPDRKDRRSIKKEIPSSPESGTESPPKSEGAKKEVESKEDRVARLFAKRTVGDKFIEAQQRYLQRKADKNSSRDGI